MKDYKFTNVPKRFKKDLEKRWNLRRAKRDSVGDYVICVTCPLCDEYKGGYFSKCTLDCPFTKFDEYGEVGCVAFIRMLGLPMYVAIGAASVYWSADDDKRARQAIKQFKKKVKVYIRWI